MEHLKARVVAAAAAEPSPTRYQARRRAVILLVGSLGFALALFQGVGGLEHAKGRPVGITLSIAFGWGLFCTALSWLVLVRRSSTLHRMPAIVLLAALATPITLGVWMHVFHGSYIEPFSRLGWRCMLYNLAMATPPLWALVTVRRGVEPRSPWILGAGIGAVCGAWAGLLVDLWCPLTNPPHVLVGHVIPLALLLVLGGLLGYRIAGVRWTTPSGESRDVRKP